MEYIREETDEKEEASTKTKSAWQKRGKTERLANRIKTFGKKTMKCKIQKDSFSEKKVLPGTVLIFGFIYASIAAAFYVDWKDVSDMPIEIDFSDSTNDSGFTRKTTTLPKAI